MSQNLQLDFVERKAFSLRQVNSLGIVFLLCGLVLSALVALYYQAKSAEYHLALAQLAQTQPQQKETMARAGTAQISDEEMKQIRETADDLITPWDSLLSTLESIQQKDIALLSITPSKKKQQLILSGQAKNISAVLLYIEQLEATPRLSQVYLQKHDVDINETFKPVNFTIVASW